MAFSIGKKNTPEWDPGFVASCAKKAGNKGNNKIHTVINELEIHMAKNKTTLPTALNEPYKKADNNKTFNVRNENFKNKSMEKGFGIALSDLMADDNAQLTEPSPTINIDSNKNIYPNIILEERVIKVFSMFKKLLNDTNKTKINSDLLHYRNENIFLKQIIHETLFGINEENYYAAAIKNGLKEAEQEFLFNLLRLLKTTIVAFENKKTKLSNPEEIFKNFFFLQNSYKESFYLTSLDENCCMKDSKQIAAGGGNIVLIHPKDILSEALSMRANSIIIVHNHPSGNCIPSDHDLIFTKTLQNACKLIGIHLLDHVIIGKDYYSFREHQLIIG